MQGLEFSVVFENMNILLHGMFWTVVLCSSASLLSIVVAVVLAMTGISKLKPLRSATFFFLWVFRGTPLLLQLFLFYFGLPQIGLYLSPIITGIIGLTLHFGVYNADVLRAGILGVETGQHEASRSLGLSYFQTMRKVIIPQALRNVSPAVGNNLIALLKESSLVSIITVPELTLSAQRAISETFRPFEFYFAAGALYYVVNWGLEFILQRVEARTALTR
ncbi:MAG: amino acid ABC transporter permease [Deltaproteobacteria bacterium]|nr:amino acid ABC transporter permease [Deltaproteobacteria bacterium]MBW2132260.1 amino acid ABC transporter permease [Deltaproteobacteria bacterium]